jgi:hypothetical protein
MQGYAESRQHFNEFRAVYHRTTESDRAVLWTIQKKHNIQPWFNVEQNHQLVETVNSGHRKVILKQNETVLCSSAFQLSYSSSSSSKSSSSSSDSFFAFFDGFVAPNKKLDEIDT